MSDIQKIKPRIIEASTDTTPEEVVPGSIILNRETDQAFFDASDGVRHQVKDPTKLPVEGGTLKGDLNLGTHQIRKDYTRGNLSNLEDSALLNKGEVDESIPQSDYEDFDETSKSFIKNKPFYKNITQVSGNIVKNPEYLGESAGGYLCDKVGFAKEQPDDLRVTITDPSSSETAVVKGFVLTCKEAELGFPSDFDDNLVLCAGESIDYAEPIIIDGVGVDLSTGMPVRDDLHSFSAFDIVVVNTVNLGDVKYIDPLFFEPHRPDYNIVDPTSSRYISNKIIQKSFNEVTVTDDGYWHQENVRTIYGYGVTIRNIPGSRNDSYSLRIKYKDGTAASYETMHEPYASDKFNQSSRYVSSPNKPGTRLFEIVSQFGGVLDNHDGNSSNDESILYTLSLCTFDPEIYSTIESWTLSGRFMTVNIITQDMVEGLVEDLDALRQEDEAKDELIRSLQETNRSLREDIDNVKDYLDPFYCNIGQILLMSEDLTGYLSNVRFYRYLRGGNAGTPLEIKAVSLKNCFNGVVFKDFDNSYFANDLYLKLLNAEVIDSMLSAAYSIGGSYNSKSIVSITLCHDIVSADSAFYHIGGTHFSIDNVVYFPLRSFTLKGDSSLGRRVKFAGNDNNTFKFSSNDSVDWRNCELIFQNLDFMDSVYFATGSPVAKSVDLMVNIIDQLHDFSADGGELPPRNYCTFGSSGLELLSEEQKKVAEDKGWKLN